MKLATLPAASLIILTLYSCKNAVPDNPSQHPAGENALFKLLSPQQTNISFTNIIEEGLNQNVLMYEYFYNGGGVAVGDINGDGLADIYFSGNTVDNKLYLNKGDMTFEDITDKAGVAGRQGPWKTGVTMADVNGDGLPDIYACYSGRLKGNKRVNQLFINKGKNAQGIPYFKDEAAAYGLADSSYSTQGFFFDYDRDGDLDMLLLNHNPSSLPVLDESATMNILNQTDPEIGIKLYRNDKNVFKNITSESYINSSALTYGLGAGIADINGDGWPDIYICNDYTVPDYLYINNHNGTFTDIKKNALGHTTHFGMGNDVADINNDGFPDIITLDMLPEDNRRQKMLMAPDNYEKYELMLRSGFYYQYMRNMLQVNNGNGTFSETGQLSGISNTDWSWAPLVADYDNDGLKDIFVTNGFARDYTDMDFLKFMGDYVQNNNKDIRRQNVLDLVKQIPSSDVKNYMFKNTDGLIFKNVSADWGFDSISNSNGGVYADLDNDGALDIVVNNINKPAFIYHNLSAQKLKHTFLQVKLEGDAFNTQGIGAKISLHTKGKVQYREQMPARGYQSSVSPILHFGLGTDDIIDTLSIIWLSGKMQLLTNIKANQLITLKETEANNKYTAPKMPAAVFEEVKAPVAFEHAANNLNDFKRQPLMVNPMSFFGPCMINADINGDGREDIFVGGATGQSAAIYIQQKNGQFALRQQPAFEADKICEDADAAFFDADGNGTIDLYIASGGYHNFTENDSRLQDRLYLNDGTGNFSKSANALPQMQVSKSCVRVADINGDSKPDLFVGGRVIPGRYPEVPRSFILINDGKGNFSDQTKTISPDLDKPGMIADAVFTDMNNDKKPDLIIAGEWMPVKIFINNSNTKLEDKTASYFDKPVNGWWNKLAVADINGDGKQDIIAGNEGLNTQCKASDDQPAEIYFKDFDDNGSVDPIFCFYIQHKSYPYVTRDELLDQMSSMRTRYTDYKGYADKTVTDIFKADELANAGHLKADRLETTYFESGTDGKLHIKTLPVQVQQSPVFTITVLDYNKDGKTDLLFCGNINRSRLRFGKSDANYGILLQGDGKGNFEYVPQWKSGFKLWGDVRSVMPVNNMLLFGINQKTVTAYKLK
ncbi:MAG: VCBS repeat-containing protein [Agriterribacter sp.]